MSAAEAGPVTVKERFLASHAELESMLGRLSDAADGALPPELIAVWRDFEAELSAHLETEEETMFPLLGDEAALARLKADHSAIRTALEELGVLVELHMVRKAAIDALVASLRAHAAREDALLYGLADAELDVEAKHGLGARLAEAALRLRRAATR